MIEQQTTVTDPTLPGTVVSLTDAAVSKLQELTKEETNPDIGLRVYVYSGGCSGFRYGMMLEDAPDARGQRPRRQRHQGLCRWPELSLLQGSQIDYVDTLMGAGFTVNNPNAVAACGCGSSFRTADDEGQRAAAPTDPRRPADRSRRATRRLFDSASGRPGRVTARRPRSRPCVPVRWGTVGSWALGPCLRDTRTDR